MKLCLSCFRSIDDNLGTCPYCGYIEGSSAGSALFIKPGTLLSGRYTIGKVKCSDRTSITYSAWDNQSNLKVDIKEYLPKELVTRDPDSLNVIPINGQSAGLFNEGFSGFVEEAKHLFGTQGNTALYDCIAENNTAYMILASIEKAPVSTPKKQRPVQAPTPQKESSARKPEISVIKPEKKDNHFYEFLRQLSLVPLWLKILSPSVLVVGIVLIILFSNGVINFAPKETEPSEIMVTEESIPEPTVTTETSKEPDIDTLIMDYEGHSYACFNNADTWEAAEKYCEFQGGHLAVITSREEHDAVWAFVKANNCETAFIGLSDAEEEGNWQWVTGEPMEFTNWSPGQPDACSPEENYGEFFCDSLGGLWNDNAYAARSETGGINFICEWDYEITGTSNLSISDIATLLPDNFFDYRVLSVEQATIAFEYFIISDISSKDLSNSSVSEWGLKESTEDTCTFFYSIDSNLYVVFEMDLKTGTTTTTTYLNYTCEDVCGVGEYDFNAWDYINNSTISLPEISTIELQNYIGTDINTAINELGGFAANEDNPNSYSNQDLTISVLDINSSPNVRDIMLISGSTAYSAYGVTIGTNWNEVIDRYILCGANRINHFDDRSFTFGMGDGNSVAIYIDEEYNVTSFIIERTG